ncbi:MAG TPA: FG-GAP-like repeat-containing protein [Candidatus Acidoferrales bacterium]|nr:FG-GAP-like repeat-containing protein [Candidatus Acidoferrales bacterium]
MLARRIAATIFVALLAAAPVLPQSSSGSSSPAATPPRATSPSTPAPQPDKGRARKAFQAGRRAEQSGDWKATFAAYSEAVTYDPSNREYKMLNEHARFQVIQALVDSAERQAVAGDIPGARALLTQALEIDPNYVVARERLAELTPTPEEIEAAKGPRLAGLPRLILKPGTQAFDYRGTTRGAYEEIGKQFGVKVVFDGDLPDRSIRFQVPNLDFDTAVMVLSRQTRTFTRVVDAHTMFVTEDTPQKEKEYTLEVEKELLLPASVSTDEMNEAVRMIREMTGITRTQLNTATRTLTVRSTEQNVALAQALLEQIEQPHGELMLEIEILELDRNLSDVLGLTPPASQTIYALTLPQIEQLEAAQNIGTLVQILQTIFGSTTGSSASSSILPSLIAFGGGKSIFFTTMPSVTANFSEALNSVRSAQRLLLRAQDGKPVTFFVGDRYPIDLGLLSSDLNSTTAAAAQALLSGLTLPRTDYDTGKGPVSVAIADFNMDGHPDLAVANQSDGTISILLGNGDGTFVAETTPCTLPSCIALPAVTTTGGTINASPSAITTGDFNNDGNMDIAVTDEANSRVMILLGDGDGTFQKPVSYTTGGNPVALVAQDFDGDGQPDLAVVNQGDGKTASTVSVLLGDKVNGTQNGVFGAKIDYPVGISPSAITTAVFNTAGFTDLAVANKGGNTVSILPGLGTNGTQNGTFAAQTTVTTGNGPAGIATADFNNDGHPDLAVTNQTDGTVSIILGNGNGTFLAQTAYAAGSGPTGMVAAAFTGTNPDLAVADETADTVDILIGNGDGTFTAPIPLPVGNSPVSVAAADLNGDGSLDVVTANNASNTVSITLNTLQSSENSSAQTAYPSAQYEDLGLKIKATPRLHDNDEVTLQLLFDIKSLTGSNINGIPILSNRNIEQTIRLRENETSVVSGILQSNQMGSTSGLPWTSTAPGVGLLTGEDNLNNQKTELLILVTPRALRLPPHDVPAIYAGRGEPSTAPAAQQPGPATIPQPGPAASPNPNQQPPAGRQAFPGGVQPGQQPPGAVVQPQQQPQQQPEQQQQPPAPQQQ